MLPQEEEERRMLAFYGILNRHRGTSLVSIVYISDYIVCQIGKVLYLLDNFCFRDHHID